MASNPAYFYPRERRFTHWTELADYRCWPTWVQRGAALAALVAFGAFWGMAIALADGGRPHLRFLIAASSACATFAPGGLLVVHADRAHSTRSRTRCWQRLNPLNCLPPRFSPSSRQPARRTLPARAAAAHLDYSCRSSPRRDRVAPRNPRSSTAGPDLSSNWGVPADIGSAFTSAYSAGGRRVARSSSERFITPICCRVRAWPARGVFVAMWVTCRRWPALARHTPALGMHPTPFRLYATAYALLLFPGTVGEHRPEDPAECRMVSCDRWASPSRAAPSSSSSSGLIYLFARRHGRRSHAAVVVPIGLYSCRRLCTTSPPLRLGLNAIIAGRPEDRMPILPTSSHPIFGKACSRSVVARHVDGAFAGSRPHNGTCRH